MFVSLIFSCLPIPPPSFFTLQLRVTRKKNEIGGLGCHVSMTFFSKMEKFHLLRKVESYAGYSLLFLSVIRPSNKI